MTLWYSNNMFIFPVFAFYVILVDPQADEAAYSAVGGPAPSPALAPVLALPCEQQNVLKALPDIWQQQLRQIRDAQNRQLATRVQSVVRQGL